MARRPQEEPRAEGPAVVSGGNPDRPGLLVLDPAGAGKHGEPPASWRELDDAAHVRWLRLPAVDTAMTTAREVLGELAEGGQPVHLLAAGEAAPLAELLALERPEALGSVLLVDPPAAPTGELVDGGTTVVERALLAHRAAPAGEALAGHGVAVHVVTYRDADRADRGAPLPLGHPEVVAAVRRALAGEPPEPAAAREPVATAPGPAATAPEPAATSERTASTEPAATSGPIAPDAGRSGRSDRSQRSGGLWRRWRRLVGRMHG